VTKEELVEAVLALVKAERVKWGYGLPALVLADIEVRIVDLAEKAR